MTDYGRCEADVERRVYPSSGYRSGGRLGSRREFDREHVRCSRAAIGTRTLNNHTGFEPYMAGTTSIEGAVCKQHRDMDDRPDHWRLWATADET